MMKRIAILLIAVILVLGLSGCDPQLDNAYENAADIGKTEKENVDETADITEETADEGAEAIPATTDNPAIEPSTTEPRETGSGTMMPDDEF